MRAWKALPGWALAGAIVLEGALVPAAAQSGRSAMNPPSSALPNAPAPRPELAWSGGAAQGSAAKPQQKAAQAGQQTGTDSAAAVSTGSDRQRHYQQARQQLKKEEKQRILGVVPNFGTTYLWNAASLSAGQKFQLALRSAIDPFTFAAAALVAGGHEVFDDEPGFQWGPAGFGQRVGAAYLDELDGDMIGSAILPALLHQDPRYFRMGHGKFRHRLLYAIATTIVCRGDSGRLQPNYSNIGGNLAAGAISNLYYPEQNAGWGQTIGNGLIVTAEGTAGGVFDEFWPDISRHLFHKDPTGSAPIPIAPQTH